MTGPVRKRYYDSAVVGYGRVVAHNPSNLPNGLNSTYQLIAALAIETGDSGKALLATQKELQIADRLLALSSADESARRNQGVAFLQMGQAHELLARTQAAEWHESRSWYQRSLDVWLIWNGKENSFRDMLPGWTKRGKQSPDAIAH